MNLQAQETYLKMQVNTAAPWELTLMLFNGAIKSMKQASDGILNHNFQMKNENIKKTIDIIDELIITLNMNYDISKDLKKLYTFMKDKLFEANLKLNAQNVNDCIDLMTELRDTWSTAMRKLRTENR